MYHKCWSVYLNHILFDFYCKDVLKWVKIQNFHLTAINKVSENITLSIVFPHKFLFLNV